MVEIGKKIQEARKKQNLSVSQLSERTKIRPHIISAIEEGNFKILPQVYIKSFIKTLLNNLNINDIEITDDNEKSDTTAKLIDIKPNLEQTSDPIIKFEDETHKKKIILDNTSIISNFTDIFKKKKLKKSSNTYFLNYIIYSIITFTTIAAVYLTFISMHSEESTPINTENKNKQDTVEIKEKNDNLLSFFDKPDSLVLVAKATDTAWMRIYIDGNITKEVLMKPGMEEEWKAKDFFLIDQGNVGAVKFFRNGEKLQQFGVSGSVIKNVRITLDQVLNANTWKLDTLKSAYKDTNSIKAKQKRKKNPEQKPKRILLEESPVNSPVIFEKKNTKPPN